MSPAAMEPLELSPSLLEPLVAVVATLGELAAAVAGPYGDVLLAVSPRSLHRALGTFIGHLHETLDQHGDPRLGQALAALGATPGATWAHVVAAATAWRDSVAALGDSWARLLGEATELRDACGDAATAEATAAATATARAGDLGDTVARWGTARSGLVATVRQLPVALDKEEATSAVAKYETEVTTAAAKVMAATKAVEVAAVATNQARAATTRARRAEVALGPLGRLVAACDEATAFPRELRRRLGAIEATLEGTKGGSPGDVPDVPEAAVAAVAEVERLWGAGTRLASRHLLGTLGDIRVLLAGGPGGPGGHRVAQRCREALGDIPRLLRGQ